jgi:hypothetical protein
MHSGHTAGFVIPLLSSLGQFQVVAKVWSASPFA